MARTAYGYRETKCDHYWFTCNLLFDRFDQIMPMVSGCYPPLIVLLARAVHLFDMGSKTAPTKEATRPAME
jgi:hypothetical protein